MTGEHTCMVLKPLNNDEVETSASDELGFLGPFYQGVFILFKNTVLCSYLFLFILGSQLDNLLIAHRFQAKIY